MTQYLLAAEADKIQDFIFRSSRLREVVGGSQLLSRFCEEVTERLRPDNANMEVVINAGGSFRILFDDKEKANIFSAYLAEVYRCATESSLTVAELVEVVDDFGKASEMAEDNLRKAKRWSLGWNSQEQMPYMAFCASCGVGLATTYTTYHKSEDKQYLCASCLNKSAERNGHGHAEELGPFLRAFYREVIKEPERLAHVSWPGKEERNGRSKKDPTEDIADYDPRHYVAYLLADGNAMGEVFGKCKNIEKMQKLSKGLTLAMYKALAVPTMKIMDNNPSSDLFIPVLPLILGGDDLFALISAPWALDFAYHFCHVYEEEMEKLINEKLGLNMPRPTVSVAVVICKSKYPYKLAHEAGESRLKDAKRTGKRIKLEGKEPYSTINFEVILGGSLISDQPCGKVRPTILPYWVMDNDESDWGLSLKRLIEQRWELRTLPNKRLSEFQKLYDPINLRDPTNSEEIRPWQVEQDQLIKRIEQRNKDQGEKIKTALKLLGECNSPYWREVSRYPDPVWYGHGLPDLLNAWDFALKLDKGRKAYEGES